MDPDSRGNLPDSFSTTATGIRYKVARVSGPCPNCNTVISYNSPTHDCEEPKGKAIRGLPGRTIFCTRCEHLYTVTEDLGLSPIEGELPDWLETELWNKRAARRNGEPQRFKAHGPATGSLAQALSSVATGLHAARARSTLTVDR